MNGGYDDGYRSVPCFWGTRPSSLVRPILAEAAASGAVPARILDLGCGEGKNSYPFAELGSDVDAVDISAAAISNGRKHFPSPRIHWHIADVTRFPLQSSAYDIVVVYGLLHCLRDQDTIATTVVRAQSAVRPNGTIVVCTFNDRSHDLAEAHPGFSPTLLPHTWYVDLFREWQILTVEDADIHETHAHNGVPHHHSVTRIRARKI